MPFKKFIIFKCSLFASLFACCLSVVLGCFGTSQKEIRGYLKDDSLNWKMVEDYGYEGGKPMVDFLTGKDLTIRLECDNDWQTKKFFIIRTSFPVISTKIEYNPSTITVKFKNGEILKPKVFTCSYTPSDLNYLRSTTSLLGAVPVKQYACYKLFFDHPELTSDDELEMNMKEALTSNGKQIDVPLIYFRKNVGKK